MKHRVLRDALEKREKAAAGLRGKTVKVGPTGEHAWIARIHEYGCQIPVTPKMRQYFAAKFGQGLKKDVISIPERPFLRAGHDQCIEAVLNEAERLLPKVLARTRTAEALAVQVGRALRDGIKQYAYHLSSPANAPITVREKGKNDPLMDTGQMIEGIAYETE